MADKEITLKFSADTDAAKKGIAEVTKELEKMSTSGSGKAADELDKVTEAADKAGAATDKLVSSWEEYKQNVREAEAEVRKLNATQFENAEQRDAAINALGDKLDELVYEGKAIEDSVKAIGISPESLQGFDSITATLNRANKEFEIALNYKEKLLNQPTAPSSALVTTNPWEEGPDGGGPAEFKARMEEMRAELEAYAAQMSNAITANDQMKSALEAELASLDRSSAGYAEQKKLLEGLISACDSYAVSSETQRQSIQRQKDSLDELNKETLKSENWEEGLKSLDKYGEGAVATSLKVQKSVGSQIAIQNRYENAVLSAQQKELKGQAELQAQMQMAGKTREELIRLVEEYGKALANAKTKEEYEAAKAGLSAARKQLTLVTREATITGAAIGTAASSVQGFATSLARAGILGRLTFKGLTAAVKTFAKSTVVLAGVQLAWEALSAIYEKVKGDLFGTAEASEKAAERARDLARAAKEAADNFNDADAALTAFLADKQREENARIYSEAIAEQNRLFKTQLELIAETSQEILFQQTLTAKDKELQLNIQKEQLHRKKMLGLIEETDYQEKMLDISEEQVKLRAEDRKNAAKVKADEAKQKAATLRVQKKELESTPLEQLGEDPEVLEKIIALINRDKAVIDEQSSLFNERDEWEAMLKDPIKLGFQFIKDKALLPSAQVRKMHEYKEHLKELNDKVSALEELIDRNNARYTELPESVKDADSLELGLAYYKKDFKDKEKYNKTVEDRIKNKTDETNAAEEAADKAHDALTKETLNYAQTITALSKLNNEKRATIQAQREIEAEKKKTERKVEKARKKVSSLEMDELKKREEAALYEASVYGEKTIEGSRAKAIAEVYGKEWRQRRDAGRAASVPVAEAGKGASREGKTIVEKARKLAYSSGSGEKINLKELSELIDKAFKTRNDAADNAAVVALYNVVVKNLAQHEKNSREVKQLKSKIKKLETSNID